MAGIARPTRIGIISDGVLTQDGNPYNLKYLLHDAQPDGVLEDLTTPNYVVGDALYRTGVVVDANGRGRGVAWPGEPTPKAADHSELTMRQTATAYFPTPEGPAEVHAEFMPGEHAVAISGPNPKYARETRDRVHAAIVNSAIQWPLGNMTVAAHWTVVRGGSAADLALACTALAASGHIPANAVEGVTMIGQLGLDGRVHAVRDFPELMQVAVDAGELKFVIPEDQVAEAVASFPDVAVQGVQNLNDALAFLAEMAA
ncbi:magnesium chelatase domain-containing protein [Streptomyces griseoruber]|uniref:magnesium chelatase domain-containing protein n=1 Tax=Streptomyces griseoruber TaxID=1943 RepID=UPI00378F99CF